MWTELLALLPLSEKTEKLKKKMVMDHGFILHGMPAFVFSYSQHKIVSPFVCSTFRVPTSGIDL